MICYLPLMPIWWLFAYLGSSQLVSELSDGQVIMTGSSTYGTHTLDTGTLQRSVSGTGKLGIGMTGTATAGSMFSTYSQTLLPGNLSRTISTDLPGIETTAPMVPVSSLAVQQGSTKVTGPTDASQQGATSSGIDTIAASNGPISSASGTETLHTPITPGTNVSYPVTIPEVISATSQQGSRPNQDVESPLSDTPSFQAGTESSKASLRTHESPTVASGAGSTSAHAIASATVIGSIMQNDPDRSEPSVRSINSAIGSSDSGSLSAEDSVSDPISTSQTAASPIPTRLMASEYPIISLGSQIVTVIPTGFSVTPSSGVQPIAVAPGASDVVIDSETISLGSSGDQVVASSTIIQPTGPSLPLDASNSASSLQETVIEADSSGSTFTPTLTATIISSLISLQTPQLISTTLVLGSSTTAIPFFVGPGGVAWALPSQTSQQPFIPIPSPPPAATFGSRTPSLEPELLDTSQTTFLQPKSPTSTSGGVTALAQGSLVSTQTPDPGWMTEAPLPIITTTTSPTIMARLTASVTKDGHSDKNKDGHPHPIFWHPHCLVSDRWINWIHTLFADCQMKLFCPSGCTTCGIQLDLKPGMYPPAIIDPPPGFKKPMIKITVHEDGTPEYDPEDEEKSATSKSSSATSSSGNKSSSTASSSSSLSSSSESLPTVTPTIYDDTPYTASNDNEARHLASALEKAWSNELQNLNLQVDSMTSNGSTSSATTSSTPTPAISVTGPPQFPSPSCLAFASGGYVVDSAVAALDDFCTSEKGLIAPESEPISKVYDSGNSHSRIRLTVSWDDTGNCPQSISPNQNDGRDCNTIFHNIISDCQYPQLFLDASA